MLLARGVFVTFWTASLLSAQGAAPKQQLTARELFYAPSQMPAAKPTAPKASKAALARPTKAPPKVVEIAGGDPEPPPPRPQVSAQPIIKTSAQTATMPANGAVPLGIRYTILKLSSDNASTEVPADTVFHSGDRIRFTIEPNASGYLYIVNQG